jgi:hypothetical protein
MAILPPQLRRTPEGLLRDKEAMERWPNFEGRKEQKDPRFASRVFRDRFGEGVSRS